MPHGPIPLLSLPPPPPATAAARPGASKSRRRYSSAAARLTACRLSRILAVVRTPCSAAQASSRPARTARKGPDGVRYQRPLPLAVYLILASTRLDSTSTCLICFVGSFRGALSLRGPCDALPYLTCFTGQTGAVCRRLRPLHSCALTSRTLLRIFFDSNSNPIRR